MADDRGDNTPPGSLEPAPPGGTISDEVRVLYIAGIGRSGSTLLCRALGGIDGFVGAGELMRIIGRGYGTGDTCSCGSAVSECRRWCGVLDRLRAAIPDLDLTRLERTRQQVTESADFLRYFVLRRPPAELSERLHEYRRFLAVLYRAVRDETGARVIVDASKNLMFANLLTETPGLDVSMLHLVRDSRGVAHSLARAQLRPGTNGRHEHFRRFGPVLGSILWATAQVTAERFQHKVRSFTRVRYEDFVAEPAQTLMRAVQELYPDAAPAQMSHVGRRTLMVDLDHLIASNPNRARHGEIDLREDTGWRGEMSAARRLVVTAMTFPLLYRYGYRTLSMADRATSRVGVAVR